MKTKNTILALALAVVALATVAPLADAQGLKIENQPAIKWVKYNGSGGYTTDSTTVSINFLNGDGTTNADTTSWYDAGNFLFPASGGADVAFLQFQVNADLSTNDSLKVVFQYTSDPSVVSVPTASLFSSTNKLVAASAQYIVGGTAGVLTAIDSDNATGRWVRAIVTHFDGSAKGMKTVSMIPITRSVKAPK